MQQMENIDTSFIEIGELLRTLRIRCGFTQKHVANTIGCGVKAISKIERGIGVPNIKILERLFILLLDHQPEYINKVGWVKKRDFS